MSKKMYLLDQLIFCMWICLSLCSCGGGGGDESGTPPANPQVVANAGADHKSLPGAVVTLDGSKSYDQGGDSLTFSWTQTGGESVVLANSDTATPSFAAPATTGELEFRLTVRGSSEDSDTVSVRVLPMYVDAFIDASDDAFWLGFGVTKQLAVTVYGGTPPYTYAWSGAPDNMPLSDASIDNPTFTTPRITDLQKIPDQFGVFAMSRLLVNRSQLTIKVSDSARSQDSDTVNIWLAPPSSSTRMTAVGMPVFLNGETTTGNSGTLNSWEWSGTKPDGSTSIEFKKPDTSDLSGATDQQVVYFVADQAGQYTVNCRRNGGEDATINVYAQSYAGTAMLSGRYSPDQSQGHCVSCHRGQATRAENLCDPWRETKHGNAFINTIDSWGKDFSRWQDALRPADKFPDLAMRATGYHDPALASTSFASLADSFGWLLQGASWQSVVGKYPALAERTGVQCESCHGPNFDHQGDTGRTDISLDSHLCMQCHLEESTWRLAVRNTLGHAGLRKQGELFVKDGNQECWRCHTGNRFIAEQIKGEAQLAPGEFPPDGFHPKVCTVCHDPHRNSDRAQLRITGPLTLPSGHVVVGGVHAMCGKCHSAFVSVSQGIADRTTPHFTSQMDVLEGSNGYEYPGHVYHNSPHADNTRFIVPGETSTKKCVTCHMAPAPGVGKSGHLILGGHSFNVSHGKTAYYLWQPDTATDVGGQNLSLVGNRWRLVKFSYHQGLRETPDSGDYLVIEDAFQPGDIGTHELEWGSSSSIGTYTTFTGGPVNKWYVVKTPARSGGSGDTLAGTRIFVTADASIVFTDKVFAGDKLYITSGADQGSYTIEKVITGSRLLVKGGGFVGDTGADWHVRRMLKEHTAACAQCHPARPEIGERSFAFDTSDGKDYDGDGEAEGIQSEVSGLCLKVVDAINDRIAQLGIDWTSFESLHNHKYMHLGDRWSVVYPAGLVTANNGVHGAGNTSGNTFVLADGSRKFSSYLVKPGYMLQINDNPAGTYTIADFDATADPTSFTITGTFPASTTTSSWEIRAQQGPTEWDKLARATWNYLLIAGDRSFGVHNLGYSVCLLRATWKELTGNANMPGDEYKPK